MVLLEALMMADSEMHPTGTPSSMTGICEMLLCSISSTALVTVSAGATLSTGVCMKSTAVIAERSAFLSTSTILVSVLTLGSTVPASMRATMDWLMDAAFATSD
jgi:hypothetical protein